MSEKVEASPEQVEGPYYSMGGKYRSDIRESLPGQKLDLTITVVHAETGEPLAGVDVDLWQCDATGHYSGYDGDPDALPTDITNGQVATNEDTFLRGRQTTNESGQVMFHTIYPGWYRLRTPHVHLKVFEGDVCNTTTQLYFPEKLNQELYQTADYARNSEQDTFNHTDPVIASTEGDLDSLWVDIQKGTDIYLGSATLQIVPGNVNELIEVPPGRIPPPGGKTHGKPVR